MTPEAFGCIYVTLKIFHETYLEEIQMIITIPKAFFSSQFEFGGRAC